MDLSLRGKVAVVCGSTQGIGLAAAQELALLGATCILFARNQASLQTAIDGLNRDAGQKHSFEVADFSAPGQVQAAIQRVLKKKPVHILVNNSGGPKAGPIVEATAADFLAGINQHLVNNHNLVQALLPGMKELQYGRIINIISTSVKVPLLNLGVSNTVRLAVAAWAKSLANEIGDPHITVNNVLPGFTSTARLESLLENTAVTKNSSKEAVAKQMTAEVPLRRFGTAAEIAAMIAFLASPAASYVNGASIPVDGGRTGAF